MWRHWGTIGFIGFILEWTTLWPWFATATAKAIYFSAPATYFLSPFIITILLFQAYRVYSLWKDISYNPTRSNIIELIILTLGLVFMAFSITVILMMTYGGPVVFAAEWVPSLFFVGGLALTLVKRLVYDILPKLFTLLRLNFMSLGDTVDLKQTKANLWEFIQRQYGPIPFFGAIVVGVLVCFTLPPLVAIPAWLTFTTVALFGLVALRYAIADYFSSDYEKLDIVDTSNDFSSTASLTGELSDRIADILKELKKQIDQLESNSRRLNRVISQLSNILASNSADISKFKAIVCYAQKSLANAAHQSIPQLEDIYNFVLGSTLADSSLIPLLPISQAVDRYFDVTIESDRVSSTKQGIQTLNHDDHYTYKQLLEYVHKIIKDHLTQKSIEVIDGNQLADELSDLGLNSTQLDNLGKFKTLMKKLNCELMFNQVSKLLPRLPNDDSQTSEDYTLDEANRLAGSFTSLLVK